MLPGSREPGITFMTQSLALPTFSALYAFGDSLSDAGNLSISTSLVKTTPASPPYDQQQYGSATGNVFSNGPTWAQDVSLALGLGTLAPSLASGTDFAYGGAETGSEPQNLGDLGLQAISLPAQLAQFQASTPNPQANALYTISIGANDLLSILDEAGLTAQQQDADVNDAVGNEITFIKQLAGEGAKNLLVLNVPDLGETPSVLQPASGSASAARTAEASRLSAAYNAALATQLAAVASPNAVTAHVVDAYQLIDNAVAYPAAYGLGNVTTPVWSGNYTDAGSGTLAATTMAAQDSYLFWDHLHPTETGHQAIASMAERLLGGAVSGPVSLPPGDQFYAAAAGATVFAASGGDTIAAQAGQVTAVGGAGALTFVGGSAASSLIGGAGSSTIFGGAGGGALAGGAAGGNVLLSEGASGANTTLTGGGAGDRLFGSASGDDVLIAGPGRASILGGNAQTTIQGGSAASVIFTQGGTSDVIGGAAADTIVGGGGSLSVTAQNGDAVFGGGGGLSVSGSAAGADSIIGAAGALSVAGQGGNMLVVAGGSASSISTGNGASLVFTGPGQASVTGGAGSLEVQLGSGRADVSQGTGGALFDVVKGAAGGADILRGFRPGTDKIQLFGYAPADIALASSGGSTMVSLTDGTTIQVVGVADLGGSIS